MSFTRIALGSGCLKTAFKFILRRQSQRSRAMGIVWPECRRLMASSKIATSSSWRFPGHAWQRSSANRSLSESIQTDIAAKSNGSPISSVHLWFDRPIMDLPNAIFVERLSQWVFARHNRHVQRRILLPGRHFCLARSVRPRKGSCNRSMFVPSWPLFFPPQRKPNYCARN